MENVALPIIIATTFEEMDAFGTPIELNYNKKTVYKTKWGATLTLVCGFLSISAIVIFGKEVVERQNPTIISNEYLMEKDELMKLDGSLFFFFGFIDSDFNPLKDKNTTLFNFSMQYIDKQQKKQINLEIDYCSNSNTFQNPDVKKLFSDVDIDNLFCLKNVDQMKDLDFKGQFGSKNYKYLQINIQTCTTLSCGSQKTIDYLMSSFFIFYFTEIVFNPKQYSNPLTKFSNSVYTRVSLFNKKNLLFKMKHTEYTTDQGYFYEDMNTQNFTTFDSFLESIKLNPKNEPDIITFQTQIGDKANRIQRKYVKVTDLLAYLGGFLKIIFTLCQLIALPINKIALETEFANQIFNLEKPPKKQIKQKQAELQDIQVINNDQKCQQQETITKEKDKQNVKFKYKDEEQKENEFYTEIQPNKSIISLQSNFEEKHSPSSHKKILKKLQKTSAAIQKSNNMIGQLKSQQKQNIQQKKLTSRRSLDDQSISAKIDNKELDNTITINEHNDGKTKAQNYQRNKISRQTCLLKPGEQFKKKIKKIEIMQTMMKRAYQKTNQILTDQEYQNSLLKIGKYLKKNPHKIFLELFNILHRNVSLKIVDYVSYIWAVICQKICCQKFKQQRQEQIQHAIKLLNERMDIVFIMKKLMEIEKIKVLLLDKDQREIFQYLPKPIVKYYPNKSDHQDYNLASNYQDILINEKEEKSYELCLKAAKAFKRIISKDKLTRMDQNVIEIIGEKSQKLLDFLDDDSKTQNQSQISQQDLSQSQSKVHQNIQSSMIIHKQLSKESRQSSFRQLIPPQQNSFQEMPLSKFSSQREVNIPSKESSGSQIQIPRKDLQQIESLSNITQNLPEVRIHSKQLSISKIELNQLNQKQIEDNNWDQDEDQNEIQQENQEKQ